MARKPRPDTRLDWRDSNMPVYRNYKMPNGQSIEFAPPEYERRYREHLLTSTYQPSWREDPTYQRRKKPNV